MTQEPESDDTRDALASVAEAMRAWRREHPTASFYEIEVAVEAHLVEARARLVAEAAVGAGASSGVAAADQSRCPTCGGPLQRRGQQTRQLLGRGGQRIPLRRAYSVCPACSAGLFPPR
jgi:uncharacterized protein with PIN domain